MKWYQVRRCSICGSVYLKKDTIQQMMKFLSPKDEEGEEENNRRKRSGKKKGGSCPR